MNNKSFNPQELAHKWLAGTLTPDEKLRFEEWYADFNDEELLITNSHYNSTEEMGNSILSKLNAKIDEQQPASTAKIFPLWRSLAAAAVVILAIGLGLIFREPILNTIDPVKQIQFASTARQYRQLTLADGSKVWLSPSSTISYPDKFRGKQRHVNIEGEAYFEVVHDTDHPFVIQSGAVKTVVLGTSFDIQAYPRTAAIEVTVVSGKVGVSSANSKTAEMVVANQRTVYQKATGRLVKEAYPAASKFLDQRKGIFDFKGASLQDVSHELEVQYGIRISLSPELSAKAFYGRLETTAPLDHTLNKLCAVMEVRWEKQNDTYLLHP
ncbi:FecR family protein [Mucilaginibacter aquaedulcis]|uniref:FecR family protein n=1 Tax=Mucilaginibacter aquaedulcis TaxID=1187081 RepID=UPI0025B5223F|nr:FecR domain-containing protein [Mucilaginibacter aquaedulcis]MDN3547264.1 FecR domain-containing protein [Mucilaginibacter aquaedulcis]